MDSFEQKAREAASALTKAWDVALEEISQALQESGFEGDEFTLVRQEEYDSVIFITLSQANVLDDDKRSEIEDEIINTGILAAYWILYHPQDYEISVPV